MTKKKSIKEKVAEQINDAADGWEEDGVSRRPPDKETEKIHEDDANDLRAIAKLILAGHKKQAMKLADELDTIVREEIPDEAWNWLHSDDNGKPFNQRLSKPAKKNPIINHFTGKPETMHQVELIVCWEDRTWEDCVFVKIPKRYVCHETSAIEWIHEHIKDIKLPRCVPIVHIGIYNWQED